MTHIKCFNWLNKRVIQIICIVIIWSGSIEIWNGLVEILGGLIKIFLSTTGGCIKKKKNMLYKVCPFNREINIKFMGNIILFLTLLIIILLIEVLIRWWIKWLSLDMVGSFVCPLLASSSTILLILLLVMTQWPLSWCWPSIWQISVCSLSSHSGNQSMSFLMRKNNCF